MLVMTELTNTYHMLKPDMTGMDEIDCGKSRAADLIARKWCEFFGPNSGRGGRALRTLGDSAPGAHWRPMTGALNIEVVQ